MQVVSKLSPIGVTCHHYVHPWTDSCAQASCGLFLHGVVDSLRIYSTVYILALLMKGRIPTLQDIKKTLRGIVQSTAFLSFTSLGYSGFLCLLRKLMGHYNIVTISAAPVFLSSALAILIERPSRRALLALYVSNVATETVWNMMVYRNMVRDIKNGPVVIFAGSMAVLLALSKAGYHELMGEKETDSMFKILRFVVGPYEEKNYTSRTNQANSFYRQLDTNNLNEASTSNGPGSSRWQPNRRHSNSIYSLVTQALRVYKRFIQKIKCCDRDVRCPHPFSCIYYVLQGSAKMFSTGLGLQLALRLVLNMKTIFKNPGRIKDIIFRRDNLNLASFLCGSSGLFRATMCILRRFTGKDDVSHAFLAGLIAGCSFIKYPDTTIALYVFWKMLQIIYNIGIFKGYVPNVPGFTIFLYCLSTSILFHAAQVEPVNLRPSYWKFLHSMSGGRIAVMNRKPMDVWGLDTSNALIKVLKSTRTKPEISWYLVK